MRDKVLNIQPFKFILPMQDRYRFAVGKTQASIYQSRCAVKSGLTLNDKLCGIGSEFGCAAHVYSHTQTVEMSKQENVILLKDPSDIPHIYQESQYTKQRTPEWFKYRLEAPVTGSTLHNALGLRLLKNQKQHIQVRDKQIE